MSAPCTSGSCLACRARGPNRAGSNPASRHGCCTAAFLNAAANLTPDQNGELFFDAIIEGPYKWKVRPVFEIYSDSVINVINQTQTFSGLAGAIWQVNDKLSFDAAARYAVVNGRPVQELRVGMTFGFPLFLSQPATAQAPFAGARRH